MNPTPYMNLILPTPGTTPGPLYASTNNAAFNTIDAHDHTSGKGLPIRAAALSIDGDVSFGGFNATNLRSTRLVSQASPLSAAADLTCLYASGGNLIGIVARASRFR